MASPNIRFSAYSDKWKKETVGDVSKVTSGGTPNRANSAYWGGSIPWVTTSLIDFNKIVSADEFITEDGLKGSSAKLFPKGTLLIALYGQGVTRGKVALLDIDATTNQACAAMMFDKNKVYQDFAFFQLMSKYEAIRNLANDGGQKNLSGGLIKSLELTLPSIKEQRQIADFLSSVDKKISLLKEKHALLTQYKKGVMQKLFKQEIRFKDDNGNDFPDWQEFSLSEIATPIKRKATEAVENVMTISAGKGFLSQEERFSQVIAGTSLDKYTHLKQGEFSYNRGNSKSYTYGCIYKLDKEQALVPYVYRSFSLNKGDTDFFSHLFQFKYLDRQLRRLISSSARMDGLLNIGEKDFYQVRVPFPCEDEQKKIAEFLDALDTKLDAVNQQIELTQTFKKGLLQQMFV